MRHHIRSGYPDLADIRNCTTLIGDLRTQALDLSVCADDGGLLGIVDVSGLLEVKPRPHVDDRVRG
eukprot:97163-Chlamydomonas_euryale.AAC.1